MNLKLRRNTINSFHYILQYIQFLQGQTFFKDFKILLDTQRTGLRDYTHFSFNMSQFRHPSKGFESGALFLWEIRVTFWIIKG